MADSGSSSDKRGGSRYGELVGDPTEYNPSRSEGDVTAAGIDAADVDPSMGREPGRGARSDPDPTERVRAWFERRGVPLSAVHVYEHSRYGTIQIETDGWIEDFDRFLELVRETDGIGYDGEVNYCRPEWVATLPAAGPDHRPGADGESGSP